jgi:hypothetical protein
MFAVSVALPPGEPMLKLAAFREIATPAPDPEDPEVPVPASEIT